MIPNWDNFFQISKTNTKNDNSTDENKSSSIPDRTDNETKKSSAKSILSNLIRSNISAPPIQPSDTISNSSTSTKDYYGYNVYEFQLKDTKFQLNSQLSKLNNILSDINTHDVWKGKQKQIDMKDFEDRLSMIDFHKDYPLEELRSLFIQLLRNVHNYIDDSSKSYATAILEIQGNARSRVTNYELTSNIQHSVMTNDLKGTIEDVYNDKIKIEQNLNKQRAALEKQLKETIEAKSLMQIDYESRIKHLKGQLESASKTHREDIIHEKNNIRAIEHTVKESTAENQRKLKAMSKKMEEERDHCIRQDEVLRALRLHLEKLETECAQLRRQSHDWEKTIHEAVAGERKRNLAEIDRERLMFQREIDVVKANCRRAVGAAVVDNEKRAMSFEASDARRRVASNVVEEQDYDQRDLGNHQSFNDYGEPAATQHVQRSAKLLPQASNQPSAVDRASSVRQEFLRRHSVADMQAGYSQKKTVPITAAFYSSQHDDIASASFAQPTATSLLKQRGSPGRRPVTSPANLSSTADLTHGGVHNRKFATEVDRYIDRMSYKNDSDCHVDSSNFRYPSPTAYANRYDRLINSRLVPSSRSLSPEANVNSPYRFPTPPEYRSFHRNNSSSYETAEVDASEEVLVEKISIRSYLSEKELTSEPDLFDKGSAENSSIDGKSCSDD